MRVALICIDKPDALQVRLDNRAAHLAHIDASGVVELAGPFLDQQGRMTGSLIVLNVEGMAEAEAWAAADPTSAGRKMKEARSRRQRRLHVATGFFTNRFSRNTSLARRMSLNRRAITLRRFCAG